MTEKPSRNLSHWDIFPRTSRIDGAGGKILRRFVFIVLFIVIVWPGCGRSETYQVIENPFQIVDQWGKARIFSLYLPPGKDAKPLLVYFHGVMSEGFKGIPALRGYTGSPVEETGLIEFCRTNKIILLVPSPVYTYSFLDREARGWLPFEKEADGVEKIIDRVIRDYPVSAAGIYLAGISAGAGFCHHLANRRPALYNAILSHSQGYVNRNSELLTPVIPGPQFGVVFGYTRGDYENLKEICVRSESIYRDAGYRTVLLKNLTPHDHSWDRRSNMRFWRHLLNVGRNSN